MTLLTSSTTDHDDSALAVVNKANLFIASRKNTSPTEITFSLDCVGSTDFGLILTLDKSTSDQAKIITTITSRNIKERVFMGTLTKKEEESCLTKFVHLFDVKGNVPRILDTTIISKANGLGPALPVFENLYELTSILQYFYETSDSVISRREFYTEGEEPQAFWDSWKDFAKTAVVAGGTIAGGSVAGTLSGGTAAIGGAVGGGALAERVWNWFD